jgi:Na+/H+ antiporter NhaC
LNTAGFIIDSLGDDLSARWMPATAFVVAAAVSFATGSSFATMGLLMPLFIKLTYYLMAGENDVMANFTSHPYALGTIGAVLAGAIWGDHCSPISETTVLSSAAAGCDHLSHVATQLPYALTVGLVSLGVGYVPIGFGISPYITLPISLALLFGILRAFGQKPPKAEDP